MDTLQNGFIRIVGAASVTFAAHFQNYSILVIIEELSDFAVEFDAFDHLTALPLVFVHYDFCYAWHAIIRRSIQLR